AVPKQGTRSGGYLRHTLPISGVLRWQCSKGSMDLRAAYGYLFHNAWMTESSRGIGAIAVARFTEGLGEGTKLRFVRSPIFRSWALLGATALCLALPGAVTTLGNSAHAGGTLEERKQPKHFKWNACMPDGRGWVSAVGIVTSDSPREFEEFARGRQLAGATIVLDSSGGSVNDSI